MAKVKKVSKIKVKRKRWFPILAPRFLGQKEIGESYLSEPQTAVGRVLKINLRDLTGNIRDQNICVSLKIKEVSGNNLQTEIMGYAYMPFFVKKLVRIGTGKIDDSFVLKTKDNKNVRLKPLVITVFAVNKSTKTSLRKKLREILEEEVAGLNFDSLINDLLRYKLQMETKKKLNKVCPVREVIMRKVKLEEKKIGKQATALPEKSSPLPKEQDSGVSHPDKEKPTRPPLTAAKHSPTHPLLEGSKEAEKKEVPPTQGRHKFPSEISRPPSTTKEEK